MIHPVLKMFCLLALVGACSAGFRPSSESRYGLDDVLFQFIDAETMKPIEGVYVNPVWVIPTPPGKVRGARCVRAALLRSDTQGWVRMKRPAKAVIDNVNFMVPGYESFTYRFRVPDQHHVMHIIPAEPSDIVDYPAWAENLQALGYHYNEPSAASRAGFYKAFPVAGFVDNTSEQYPPQLYYIKRRSPPSSENLSVFTRVDECGKDGEDIGLGEAAAEANKQRALIYLDDLCDTKWDTAKGRQRFGALFIALWLVGPPDDANLASKLLAGQLPEYPEVVVPSAGRAFTQSERLRFCAWMKPYAVYMQ